MGTAAQCERQSAGKFTPVGLMQSTQNTPYNLLLLLVNLPKESYLKRKKPSFWWDGLGQGHSRSRHANCQYLLTLVSDQDFGDTGLSADPGLHLEQSNQTVISDLHSNASTARLRFKL